MPIAAFLALVATLSGLVLTAIVLGISAAEAHRRLAALERRPAPACDRPCADCPARLARLEGDSGTHTLKLRNHADVLHEQGEAIERIAVTLGRLGDVLSPPADAA